MNSFLETKNKIIRKIKTPECLNISFMNKFKNIEKMNSYLIYKGLEYLKIEFPYLPITDYSIQKSISKLNNYVFIILKSNSSLTHPFVIFANKYSNELYIVMSFGKDKKLGQYQLDLFEKMLDLKWKNYLNDAEYYAIYLLLADSIHTRKLDLITHNKFSLLNCDNIKQCYLTKKKLKKEKGSRLNLIKEKELYYKKKAIKLLEKFFSLLDNGNFTEAYNFLKVEKVRKGKGKGRIIKKTEYFGKERLDTFFKSNKRLIGHLQIFIDLYQFIHLLISRLN